MRSNGMSAAASAGGAGLAGAAAASIFGVSISGDSSVMPPASPVVARTLAADRHPLNRPRNAAATIFWMRGPRSGKVRSSQKARLCARQESSRRNLMTVRNLLAATAISSLLAGPAAAQEALVTYKSLSPELALDLARATLADCQKARLSGDGRRRRPLRRHASPAARPLRRPSHGVDRFRQGMDRGQLSHQHDRTQRHQPARDDAGRNPQPARRRHRRRRVDGRSGGSLLGAVGVSGAPGGDADEACAKAGIDAVRDKLDF